MNRRAWRASVHGVTESRTRLSHWHIHNIYLSQVLWRLIKLLFSFCFASIFPEGICCCLVAKLWSTLCNPIKCSTLGFPSVLHYLPEFAQIHAHWVSDAIQPSFILCHPLLLLPSIFPSIKVFPNESALPTRWPKYQSFSFSISLSNEYLEWFPLEWTGWISMLSKGFSRVFNTTV